MDEKIEMLLERFRDYIKAHEDFDIVQTKFGLLQITLYDECDSHVKKIGDAASLVHNLVHEVCKDVFCENLFGDHDYWLIPQEIEISRQRLLPYFAGLPFEAECISIMEEYLAHDPYEDFAVT